MARARRRGFGDCMLETAVIPKESKIAALRASTTDADKAKTKAYDQALTGYDELLLSIDCALPCGKAAFSLVESSRSID